MIDIMPFYHATRDIYGAAMSINVIGAILRIILENKDHAFLPHRTPAEIVDEFTYGQIVIGDMGKGCELALTKPFGMVVAKAHGIHMR